jgi:cob(I)alamin adenosyltransferase
MFYTKKGDDGKTTTFGCDQRFSKSSAIAETLGSIDELDSYLGIIKAKSQKLIAGSLLEIQENLFIIQAQVAGVDKKITEEKIKDMEKSIDSIEKEISPIKSFIIPGANEISAMFDFARTLSRKTERRVVSVSEENLVNIDSSTLAYLNRLSSLLFALARLSASESDIDEKHPTYS